MNWFFSSGPNYDKLKTNLRLTMNRMKLIGKKRTELSLKARKDIFDYAESGKIERAKILVEQIIREDYFVEVLEIIEMYCDLLVARFGLIQTQEAIDPGLEEAIATILWVSPRIKEDVPELAVVADQLESKYSKEFSDACQCNSLDNVNERVIRKLSPQKYPDELIDQYLDQIKLSYQSHINSPVKTACRLSGDKGVAQPSRANEQPSSNLELPELPSVPGESSVGSHDSSTDNMDFDDLTRRFQQLKRRK